MGSLMDSAGTANDPGARTGVTSLWSTPFERLPRELRIRAFGVEYGRIHTSDGGDLFVTEEGWPFVSLLLPENWYADRWFAQMGQKLPGGTGHVYRVRTREVANRSIQLVVKFSRVGQEVPLEIASSFEDFVRAEDLANARFNSPFEEFGLVCELRRGQFGPKELRLLAQRPLAIFAPPEEFELWQLGRSHNRFSAHQHLLAKDQEETPTAIELDIRREYVVLYSWIEGLDAEQTHSAGLLSEQEMQGLTLRVWEELQAKGFRVLDNKPKHFILRSRRHGGELLRRGGQLVYGMVDFELLQRTAEYQHRFQYARRVRYWQLQNPLSCPLPAELPSHLARMNIFGVDYIYGTAPNEGKVWVVGSEPELFDYFLPERWRRTPRTRLSPIHDAYRTKTRDSIHLVYRRSTVGERPHADPFYDRDKRIREYGYNSPFEEFAIVERLRKAGISTTHPRAIYRSGHQSTTAGHLRDTSRYISHAYLLTPEPESEPILSPHHEYYTLWGYFRGIDPHRYYRREGHWGFIDVEKALDDGLVSHQQHQHVIEYAHERLEALGFPGEAVRDDQFLLVFNPDESLRAGSNGELEVIWAIDALTAFEYSLLTEGRYRQVLERMQQRLRAVGFEALNLGGTQILLAMNMQGQLREDQTGEPEACLCSFELVRPQDGSLL